jgi:hypothetical protein
MVDGGQAALVMEIGHQLSFWKRFKTAAGACVPPELNRAGSPDPAVTLLPRAFA